MVHRSHRSTVWWLLQHDVPSARSKLKCPQRSPWTQAGKKRSFSIWCTYGAMHIWIMNYYEICIYVYIYICYKYICVCVHVHTLIYVQMTIERWYVCSVFVHRDVDVSGWTMLDLNNRGAALHLSDMICRWSKPGLINPKRLVNWGVPFKYWMKCGWNDYWRSTPLIVINQGLVSSGVDITWSPKTVPNHFP